MAIYVHFSGVLGLANEMRFSNFIFKFQGAKFMPKRDASLAWEFVVFCSTVKRLCMEIFLSLAGHLSIQPVP